MPHNTDFEPMIEQPVELAIMDFNTVQNGAHVTSRIAAHQIKTVDHLIKEGVLWIEGEVESPTHQHLMAGNLEQIREELLYLAEIANEQAAQLVAIVEVVKVLLRQRDQAVDAKTAVEQEFVKMIADNHNCTVEQADKLLTLMINGDESIMEADLIIGYDVLAQYRDQMAALINALDLDMEG